MAQPVTKTLKSGTSATLFRQVQLSATGRGMEQITSTAVAAADPKQTDDSSESIGKGTFWHNELTHITWICEDPTVNAAVWRKQNAPTQKTILWDDATDFIIDAVDYQILDLQIDNGASVGGQFGITGLEHPGTVIVNFDVLTAGTLINALDGSITWAGGDQTVELAKLNAAFAATGRRASLHIFRLGTTNFCLAPHIH